MNSKYSLSKSSLSPEISQIFFFLKNLGDSTETHFDKYYIDTYHFSNQLPMFCCEFLQSIFTLNSHPL